MQGFYCAIEGIDRCGKGTAIRGVEERYKVSEFSEHELFLITEPNNKNRMGQHIRECLADKEGLIRPSPLVFQEYYMADRFSTMVCDVIPALKRNAVILSDRSFGSTLAYGTLGVPMETLLKRFEAILGSVIRYPHLMIYIDIPAEEAMRRKQLDAQAEPQFFEKQSTLERVREAYLKIMNEMGTQYIRYEDEQTGELLYKVHKMRCVIVDGIADPATVLERVWNVFSSHLRWWTAQQQGAKES